MRVPLWAKLLVLAGAVVVGILFLDRPAAVWARAHPIPNLAYGGAGGGDAGRELMWLEQWGQGVCSVFVIAAVAFLDKAGARRALSLAIGCLATLAVTHLCKDLIGRSRPFVGLNPPAGTAAWGADGAWVFGGPGMGFTKGSAWGSLPSAHTSAAFALSCGLSWFYPRARGLFMALAVITAGQRVLHNAHYVSDVFAGMAIGVFVTRFTLRARVAGRLIALAPPAARAWWLRDRPAAR
jgi:undecaprenyl-diphosphatase